MKAAAAFLTVLIASRVAPAATKPAPPDPLVDAAVAAVEAGALPAFTATVEKAASDALADPATADLPRLVRLATLREFGRWFGRVKEPSPDQKAALTWLVRERRVAPALLLAATSADPPDRVLNVLTALRKDQRDRLDRFPELTAAVCLVWDDADRFGGEDRPMDLPRVVRVFRDYADNPGLTRNAAGELPVELLVFVVDNMLGEGEVEWARRQYGAGADVGDAFFDVGYGASRPLKRDPAKPDDDPETLYTIANLRKFGGSLADQAYFAAQVGKAIGVPTAVCTGLAREGQEAQAWVAYLRGGRWDAAMGRYRVHGSATGEALDPQTMEHVPMGELALAASAANMPAPKRAAAAALCKLLDRAAADKQLAALRRAVELSPSDRRAWRALAEWGRQHRPGSEEHRALASLVMSQLMPRAEDVALDVRMRMLEKLAAEDRAAALAELRPAFQRRADLSATIQLARGRALVEKKDYDGALRELGEVLALADAAPTQTVAAMRMVDDVLRERSQLDRLADAYEQVWSRMRPPAQSPVPHTTAYFAIAQEYAQLLEELGWAEPVKR
jgi:tetratricopeptide (TPR) repeat protein